MSTAQTHSNMRTDFPSFEQMKAAKALVSETLKKGDWLLVAPNGNTYSSPDPVELFRVLLAHYPLMQPFKPGEVKP